MTILFLSNSFGALANFRYEFILRLRTENQKVFLCFPFGENTEKLDGTGCQYINIPMTRAGTNPFQELKLINAYRKIIHTVSPDIIFSYTIKPNIYGGLAAQTEHVHIVQSVTGLGTALENRGPLRTITTFLYQKACKNSQRVFCQNDEIMKYFQRHNIGTKHLARIAGSGVNLDHFKYLTYPNRDTIDFLFVARIRKEKGINQYLEAAKQIKQRYPKTVFHVVGFCDDDAYLPVLTKMQDEGIILYHGAQKDMLEFQQINCCTIHPTFYPEGMSNVLLESAACGRPIITTNRSGCREAIEDGVTGFICKQQDTQNLVSKIEKFLNLSWEQRKAMGLAGRAKMEREFDRRLVVQAYWEEIQRVLGDTDV